MNIMTLGNMKAKIEFDQDAELFREEILGLTGSNSGSDSLISAIPCKGKTVLPTNRATNTILLAAECLGLIVSGRRVPGHY